MKHILSAARLQRLKSAAEDARIHARGSNQLKLRAQWLADDMETPLGERFGAGRMRQVAVESFHPSGTIEHVPIPASVPLKFAPPKGAEYLRLEYGEASEIVSREQLQFSERLEPADKELFGPSTAKFAFPIFAERFDDSKLFFAQVRALYDWIIDVSPFNEPTVAANFALRAFYWSTDLELGQFDTPDISYDCKNPVGGVTFYGDNGAAKAALRHLMLNNKYGLVLINSKVRGGAGGIADEGFPAWASTANCPGEVWQGVALHEIGHALDLADEYVHAGPDSAAPKEHNFAISADLTAAPWRDQFSEKPVPTAASIYSNYDQSRLGQPDGRPNPGLEFVGLFQGARYSQEYYRSSLNCLMRQTDFLRFCPVCAELIRNKIRSSH